MIFRILFLENVRKQFAEEFKCDKCGSMYDNLNTLTKHMNTRHQSGIEQKDTTDTEFKQKEDSNNEQKGDLCICPNCKKEFNTSFILTKHFHEDHVDKDPHMYHKNMDNGHTFRHVRGKPLGFRRR